MKLDPGPLNRRRAPLSQHGNALTTIQYPKIRRRLMPVSASAAHRVAAVQRVLTEDRYGCSRSNFWIAVWMSEPTVPVNWAAAGRRRR